MSDDWTIKSKSVGTLCPPEGTLCSPESHLNYQITYPRGKLLDYLPYRNQPDGTSRRRSSIVGRDKRKFRVHIETSSWGYPSDGGSTRCHRRCLTIRLSWTKDWQTGHCGAVFPFWKKSDFIATLVLWSRRARNYAVQVSLLCECLGYGNVRFPYQSVHIAIQDGSGQRGGDTLL